MVVVTINGRMESTMMVSTNMIKNLVLEYSIGQMVNNIKDIGGMVSSMEGD
jgi:hypothetical protein